EAPAQERAGVLDVVHEPDPGQPVERLIDRRGRKAAVAQPAREIGARPPDALDQSQRGLARGVEVGRRLGASAARARDAAGATDGSARSHGTPTGAAPYRLRSPLARAGAGRGGVAGAPRAASAPGRCAVTAAATFAWAPGAGAGSIAGSGA